MTSSIGQIPLLRLIFYACCEEVLVSMCTRDMCLADPSPIFSTRCLTLASSNAVHAKLRSILLWGFGAGRGRELQHMNTGALRLL